MKPFIYLCGPIHGLTLEAASTWRQLAADLLLPEFDVLDPLRGKEWEGINPRLYTDQEIVLRDLDDIRRSRAVLRYCPGPSHGSDMETFYAKQIGVPVVTFGHRDPREALSIWLRYHTVQNLAGLDDAVRYLKNFWTERAA